MSAELGTLTDQLKIDTTAKMAKLLREVERADAVITQWTAVSDN